MINCTMLKGHLTTSTLRSVQISHLTQSPRQLFSSTARNHPRHRTSTRGRWPDDSPRDVADFTEKFRRSEGGAGKPNRRGSREQVKTREDFLRSFQGAATGSESTSSRFDTEGRGRSGRPGGHYGVIEHLDSEADFSKTNERTVGLPDSDPSLTPTDATQIIKTPQDIWSSKMVYLDSSSRTRSTLHVSTDASPSTTSATSFFAASRPTFLYSSGQLRTTPTNSAIPEIAIIGASNVGKSSFLNALVSGLPGQQQQQQLARTSARAGHTRTMNAYGVGPNVSDDPVLASRIKKRLRAGSGEVVPNHSLVLVDTPGYGFRSQKEWGDGIIGFLEKRTMLKGVVVLVAAEKNGLGQFDLEVLKMVSGLDKGVLVIVTKGDKLGKLGLDKKRKAKNAGAEGDGNYMHAVTTEKLREIAASAKKACRLEGQEQRLVPRIYLTAAEMPKDKKWKGDNSGGNKGIAGARAAILELAGLAEPPNAGAVSMDDIVPEKRADMASPEAWSGEVIPFEELEKMYKQEDK
ncbi:P-loop containing nucleoside triphosphate hydrolase protein [Plectosphaerella plurivora]|uniref:P-loop containing nucleoside triphosphate hydrolase protein n=1 Tax=Plectosphaerella plurivora TaxID=936078 RepID=A0A9P8V991_9PEZI|nr:P-loop containing nucleoside triphosphate hydrolase protein [Plectosphaerella plurivora]